LEPVCATAAETRQAIPEKLTRRMLLVMGNLRLALKDEMNARKNRLEQWQRKNKSFYIYVDVTANATGTMYGNAEKAKDKKINCTSGVRFKYVGGRGRLSHAQPAGRNIKQLTCGLFHPLVKECCTGDEAVHPVHPPKLIHSQSLTDCSR